MVLSIGGADGEVDTTARQAVVDRVLAINERIPLDGIDWDIEQSAVVPDDIVAISTELVKRRGEHFAVTLAPNGSTIDAYLPIARELAERGLLPGNLDTWDVQWMFHFLRRGFVSAHPNTNLIQNVGFGADATHTTGRVSGVVGAFGTLEFPLVHPAEVQADLAADLAAQRSMLPRPRRWLAPARVARRVLRGVLRRVARG